MGIRMRVPLVFRSPMQVSNTLNSRPLNLFANQTLNPKTLWSPFGESFKSRYIHPSHQWHRTRERSIMACRCMIRGCRVEVFDLAFRVNGLEYSVAVRVTSGANPSIPRKQGNLNACSSLLAK